MKGEYDGGWEDIDRLNRIIRNELLNESDRGLAVLSICLLEDSLRESLGRVVSTPGKKALERLAPKGSMSALIANCLQLGIISERERVCIAGLCDVRNEFAHKMLEGLSFQSPQIVGLMKSVQAPSEGKRSAERDQRQKFLGFVGEIYVILSIRRPTLIRIKKAQGFAPAKK